MLNQTTNRYLTNLSNDSIYFFNRSDRFEILSRLSPLRTRLEKAIPIFHYVGLVTNLLCFFILVQKQMINRKSIFHLIFLAFSDFMYNFLSELPNFLILINLLGHNFYKISNFSCFFYDYGPSTFHFYSVLLTLFVTAERFNHIYNPLKFNRTFFLNNTKSKICIGFSLLVISSILALPRGFLMVYNPDQKECDARDSLTKNLFNTTWTYYNIYFTFTEPVLIWFIPGILILNLNFYVIYKIFKSKQINSYRFIASLNSKTDQKTSKSRFNNTNMYESDFSQKIYEQIMPVTQQVLTSEKFSNNRRTLVNYKFMNDFFVCSLKTNNSQSTSDEFEMEKITSFRRPPSIELYEKRNYHKNSSCDAPLIPKDFSLNYKMKCDNCKNIPINPIIEDRSSINSKRRSIIFNLNRNNSKLSVNQISHYITIIILGFYLIFSTIPYAILLSLQNNSTLYLNYKLVSLEDYLNNLSWIKHGLLRDCAAVAKLFFELNHCFNFFLYFLFNRLFRITFIQQIVKIKSFIMKKLGHFC
ncbi:unnamed protein product [Brachionus calyciflorus]|uniref:G-protein coupled receptors family 1 profile domain-containing protein n=1 Tax=Brachionus calyciflorus TaxID=104777 RepID=A0A813T5Y8_9BILA|nr:unnamed protein product [Brachionus calyciflorus]